MKFITVFFMFLTMNSCGNSKNTTSLDKQSQLTLDGEYSIHQINGSITSLTDLTINFDNNTKTISGYSGCNRFSGAYEINGNTLKIGPLASTKMACTQERDSIESQLLNTLAKINAYEYLDGTLILKTGDKEAITSTLKEYDMVVTYQAATRGFFEKIWVNQKSINFSNDYNLTVNHKSDCDEKDWNELINLIKKIDVTSLPNLEPPSKTNQYDAAPAATLEIGLQGKIYKTAVFDHGNPPKSIEDIVNKVLSMKKLVEKG